MLKIKLNNKKIIALVIVFVSIFISIYIFFNRNLEKLELRDRKERAEIIDDFDYMVVNNTLEDVTKIKTAIVITRENGIDSVQYNFDGKSNFIECYGKTKLGIDGVVTKDKEYEIKVISGGNIKTEKLKITDEYIKQCLSLKKNQDGDLQIDFKNILPTDFTLSYKLGDSNSWKKGNTVMFSPVNDLGSTRGNNTSSNRIVDIMASTTAGDIVKLSYNCSISVSYCNVLNQIGSTASQLNEFGVTLTDASGKTLKLTDGLSDFQYYHSYRSGYADYYYRIDWTKLRNVEANYMCYDLGVCAISDPPLHVTFGYVSLYAYFMEGDFVGNYEYSWADERKRWVYYTHESYLGHNQIDYVKVNIEQKDDSNNSGSGASVTNWYLANVTIELVE